MPTSASRMPQSSRRLLDAIGSARAMGLRVASVERGRVRRSSGASDAEPTGAGCQSPGAAVLSSAIDMRLDAPPSITDRRRIMDCAERHRVAASSAAATVTAAATAAAGRVAGTHSLWRRTLEATAAEGARMRRSICENGAEGGSFSGDTFGHHGHGDTFASPFGASAFGTSSFGARSGAFKRTGGSVGGCAHTRGMASQQQQQHQQHPHQHQRAFEGRAAKPARRAGQGQGGHSGGVTASAGSLLRRGCTATATASVS